MTAWTIVLVAGAGSFLLRASVALLVGHIAAPAWLERLAAFVGPAAFTGIAATALTGTVATADTEAIALATAVVVTAVLAMRGRSVAVAFVSGLASLWSVTGLAALL